MNDIDTIASIEPGRLYVVSQLRSRFSLGDKAWRELRDAGLPTIRLGKQTYVFGDDLLTAFRTLRGHVDRNEVPR